MGFLACVLIYVLNLLSCGLSLTCRLSDPVILMSTILFYSWLILDNIDGKQARRTDSSTPLGLLFDHQVDAISVTITATYFGTLILYGDSPYTLMIFLFGAMTFYFATWEELYVGSMNFPVINGPSDGCLALGLISFLMGALGPEFFATTLIMNIPITD